MCERGEGARAREGSVCEDWFASVLKRFPKVRGGESECERVREGRVCVRERERESGEVGVCED